MPRRTGSSSNRTGPLVADGSAAAAPAILRAALRRGGVVVLGGVDGDVVRAASGLGRVHVDAERRAPFADLAGRDGAAWEAARGSATRSQLRRSRIRLAELGPLSARRADTAAEGAAFLAELARLHQLAWQARGHPGAFAEPAFLRFHTDLVARGLPRGEIALWRLSAGERPVAYLYNMEWRGHVLSYQSGFDLDAVPRASPGLVAHAAAITAATEAGAARYDFLAGDTRYKRELADASYALYWAELSAPRQPRGLYRAAQTTVAAWARTRRDRPPA